MDNNQIQEKWHSGKIGVEILHLHSLHNNRHPPNPINWQTQMHWILIGISSSEECHLNVTTVMAKDILQGIANPEEELGN